MIYQNFFTEIGFYPVRLGLITLQDQFIGSNSNPNIKIFLDKLIDTKFYNSFTTLKVSDGFIDFEIKSTDPKIKRRQTRSITQNFSLDLPTFNRIFKEEIRDYNLNLLCN